MGLLAQSGNSDQSLLLTPKRTRKWLQRLPLANMGESTRLLYEALIAARDQPVTARQRIESMELIVPTARLAVANIHKRLVTQTYPLSRKTHTICQLHQALVSEIARSYHQAAEELAAGGGQRVRDDLVLSLHRAMEFMLQGVVTNSSLHLAWPTGSWPVLTQLYRLAEAHQISGTPIRDNELRASLPQTCEQLFIYACILAMVQPHALHPGDAERLMRLFSACGSECKVSVPANRPDVPGGTYLDLDSPTPPQRPSMSPPDIGDGLRYIGLGPLISNLSNQDPEPRGSGPVRTNGEAQLARLVVDRLIRPATRRTGRVSRRAHMHVLFGLTPICKALRRPRPDGQGTPARQARDSALALQPRDNRAAEPEEHVMIRSENVVHRSAEQWDIVGRGSFRYEAAAEPPAADSSAGTRQPASDIGGQQVWEILDSSGEGVRLQSLGGSSSLAQVGELIGLRQQDDTRHYWALGVIRWLRNPGPGRVEIGVQFLSPRVALARVNPDTPPTLTTLSSPDGLLLAGSDASSGAPTLILPAGKFGDNASLIVAVGERRVQVRLGSIAARNASFEQYPFVIQQKSPQGSDEEEWKREVDSLEKPEGASSPSDNGFQSVWSSL